MPKYAYMMHNKKYNVAVVGARGYSGLELTRILLKHPFVNLTAIIGTDTIFTLSDYLPEINNQSAQNIKSISIKDLENFLATSSQKLHTVFLATPNEVSLELAPKFIENNINVIDVSGAYRLESAQKSALEAKLKTEITYGLSPWADPTTKSPTLISNPGCYATSVLMPLIPLLKAGAIDSTSIVIDSKSGTTGAGRKAQEKIGRASCRERV